MICHICPSIPQMYSLHCLHVPKSHEIHGNPVKHFEKLHGNQTLSKTEWKKLGCNMLQHIRHWTVQCVSTKWHDHIWSHDTHGGNAHT